VQRISHDIASVSYKLNWKVLCVEVGTEVLPQSAGNDIAMQQNRSAHDA
jgi:hypothetical protein